MRLRRYAYKEDGTPRWTLSLQASSHMPQPAAGDGADMAAEGEEGIGADSSASALASCACCDADVQEIVDVLDGLAKQVSRCWIAGTCVAF